MTLEEALEKAAGELPEDWIMIISVERGSGWVTLENDEGDEVGSGPVDCDESYADCVLRLLEEANEDMSTTLG